MAPITSDSKICSLSGTTNHCGSELARDGGLSVNISVECYGLIASKLAPTGDGVDF